MVDFLSVTVESVGWFLLVIVRFFRIDLLQSIPVRDIDRLEHNFITPSDYVLLVKPQVLDFWVVAYDLSNLM